MRILFVGAVEFSYYALQATLESGGDVAAIVTLDAQYAKRHADYADLTPLATQYHVPIYYVDRLNDHLPLVMELKPDVIFIFGWSQLLSPELLQIPPLGCIGTHPALLPRNRGRHPLIWALVEGLTESGLTFFYLDEGTDTGDILWQRAFPISQEDDARTLYQKMIALAQAAIPEFLPLLAAGTAPRIPQDERLATYWRKRSRQDGEIDWSQPALHIYNLVRALTHPYPGAHSFLNDQEIKVWRTKQITVQNAIAESAPGTVIAMQDAMPVVQTGAGQLLLSHYEADGLPLKPGDQLGRKEEEAQ